MVVLTRQAYQKHAESAAEEDKVKISADLQKIIMLPRLDMFKKVIFSPRLIAYHETLAPIRKKGDLKPRAIIWHEAITGKKQRGHYKLFLQVFKKKSRYKEVCLWLDNCSSQNKNWCLYSFLVQMVNSSDIEATEICLHYFEPGNSLMSADSFHHQVELSLKK